ncbi:MAG: hypothetical protein KDD62_11370, partial [Bdellovibrionales bacterium]|nr:hypothetical protein [Bdellovibrionales bacterium]
TEQLEPVHEIPWFLDKSRLAEFGITTNTAEEIPNALKRSGLSCSSGSVMQRAIASCRLEFPSTTGPNQIGSFLSEHRRSVPLIVAFCNRLSYNGRLVPKRPANPLQPLPTFAWANIPGIQKRLGPSWLNTIEADAIVDWLSRRQQEIEQAYEGRTLEDLVAIITPFAAQSNDLKRKIRQTWPRMVVGTVNSLQGAEREIVLFSPTYDRRHQKTFFFNRNSHMLNVAVSRAKDSFVVFGDMYNFKRGDDPIGLLSRFLYADPANEITDVVTPKRDKIPKSEISRLRSLAEHRRTLKEAFEVAQQRVVVVSPFISIHAIRADGIEALASAAIQRGIEVTVYTDCDLDRDESRALRDASKKGRACLRAAGVVLKVCKQVHSKSLIVDSDTLVEGSFNWLSAVRNSQSKFHRLEASWCYHGPTAAKEIYSYLKELDTQLVPDDE